ncbi:DUF2569 family protein [Phyllobacterium sp.]|uniref:DUF2569 family protein n=1 Tax=unclassified Phyllobacterium TaxID=2638441 RepID=UPI0031FBC14C|nr:DUF2569 family protein [Phyllobacterium sp.]
MTDEIVLTQSSPALPRLKIGGWLVPVIAIFSYAVVKSGFDLISWGTLVLRSEIGPQRFGVGYALIVQQIIVGVFINLIWLIVGSWSLKLLFDNDRRAPKLLVGLMVLALISRASDVYNAFELASLSSDYATKRHVIYPVLVKAIFNTTICIIGICYVLISKRVKNTFR